MNSSTPTLDHAIPLPGSVAQPHRLDRRLLLVPLVIALALGAAKLGRTWWTVGRFSETTEDAFIGGDVTVISPKITGLVERVYVVDNQAVHAGDVLLKIDDRDYVAALARADAGVAAQEAALENLDAMRNLQNAIIAQAEAGVGLTDAEINRTRDDWVRFKQLTEQSAESVQSYQRADAGYKSALAEGQKAQATLNAARLQIAVIDTQKRQIAAALAQAIAERELARLTLSYTDVRAPIDGIVGNRSVRVGSFAPAGAELMAVVPSQGLWIDANFKETQLAHMRTGEPVFIEADARPGEVFYGYVTSLSPATGAQFSVLPAENATGSFTKIVQRVPVRIALAGDASSLGKLRPGLSVTVKVDQRSDRIEPRS